MFESLSSRLTQLFTNLRRRGKLNEADVDAALREVRLALLEADVHYSVVKDFTNRIRTRAVGAEVSRALNPAQQVIKIVHEELVTILGGTAPLNLTGEKPRVVLLAGLQGSGKTTTAAKLALLLRQKGERVMLVAGDPYRPAAVEQLQVLGEQTGIPVYANLAQDPPTAAGSAYQKARDGGFSVVIMDTAGRSQIDGKLMKELTDISIQVPPAETLLVVDAMIGQEALHVAEEFNRSVPLTGMILTKMDGDARGGAAISMRSVTGVPIKFIGTGEKIEALEAFHPERLANRILGMGDILGLIEKAEAVFSREESQEQAERFSRGKFSLEDMLEILRSSKKMGSISQMLDLLPGSAGKAAREIDPTEMDRSLKRVEAIISSMTMKERKDPDILNASRRRRIAAGCGLKVQDVNSLVKQYRVMEKMMKTLEKQGGKGLAKLFG